MFTVEFEDGTIARFDSSEHIITTRRAAEEFDIDNPETWESDRAWVYFCQPLAAVGRKVHYQNKLMIVKKVL